MDGKVALITGASSGIGRATALAFAERGARVAVAARRGDELDALVDEIAQTGVDALALPTDVAISEQVQRMVEATVERLSLQVEPQKLSEPLQ